jgi:hypothetical protein
MADLRERDRLCLISKRVFLPGVTPSGRKVVLPHVVVMGFDEMGRVAYEHIY